MTDPKKIAKQILQQAQEAAERKFTRAIAEVLPTELQKEATEAERQEYLRRKANELLAWQQDKRNNYRPLDIRYQSKYQLLAFLTSLVLELEKGISGRVESLEHAKLMLAERLFVQRYRLHLLELLHPKPEAWPNVAQLVEQVAEDFPHVPPAQKRAVTEELEQLTEDTFKDLETGIHPPQEIAQDLEEHAKKARAELRSYSPNVNTWPETGQPDGRFHLTCHVQFYPQLAEAIRKEAARRKEFAEQYISEYLNRYQDRFAEMYERSQDKERVLKGEIDAVRKVLTDADYTTFAIHYGQGQTTFSGSKYSPTAKRGYPNQIAYWYQVIQVRAAKPPWQSIEPGQTMEAFIPGLWAVILHRYQQFLEGFSVQAVKHTKPKKQGPAPEETEQLGKIVKAIKKALDSEDLLNSEGEFTGKPWQLRCLFLALRRERFFSGIPNVDDTFVMLMKTEFNASISDRILRYQPKKIEKEKDLRERFQTLIRG